MEAEPDDVEAADRATGPTAASDRPDLHLRRRLAVGLSGLALYGIFLLLSAHPGVAESLYADGLGPLLMRPLSLATGLVPVPLAELVLVLFLGRQARGAWRGLRDLRRGRWRARRAAAAGGLRLLQDVGAVVGLFYLLWGFNYARPELESRLDLPDGSGATVGEVRRLAESSVEAGNWAYRALHASDDAGRPTPMPEDPEALRESLREGWERARRELSLPDHYAAGYGPVKRFWGSVLLAKVGISGFFFPWTGEALINSRLPAVSAVKAMAHEQAHQRGVAPEDEASFVGFVAAARAPDPLVRYSALVFVQRHLLVTLARSDREAARELADRRLPGVQRDLEDLREYIRRHAGAGWAAAHRVNDAYLRSNRVEGGIASYGLVTRLVIAYARAGGGPAALWVGPGRPRPGRTGSDGP